MYFETQCKFYIYKKEKLVFQFFEWKNIVFEYEAPTFSFLILFFFSKIKVLIGL
jgi:hypothetical protein